MRVEVTELPESRARLEVSVEPGVFQKRVERAAKQLAGEMKLPGFRKGKVPPQLVIQRVGREGVVEQAVRDSLPEWYEQAIVDSGLATVGEPKLDVEDLPGEGEALEFSIEIGVRPEAKLGDYLGVEAPRAEVEVPDEAVAEELDRLREGLGSLNPVERPAAEGDVTVIDFRATTDGEPFPGSERKDYAVELGADGLLPEFAANLTGRAAGDEATFDVSFPEGHEPADLAGKTATFTVQVREVREKELPALDDDFAQAASEFDTLEELRAELRSRLATALESRADAEFREAAVAAAAEASTVELPDELVHSRAHELWERFERSLAAQGIDPQTYVQMQGKDRHELIGDGEDSAAESLRREAMLAAVAEAEGIEVSDEDLVEALGPGQGSESPEKMLGKLREAGRDGLLRDEVRMRKAADLIAERATPIPKAQAEAREAIWTPEKESREPGEGAGEGGGDGKDKPGKLWTPGG